MRKTSKCFLDKISLVGYAYLAAIVIYIAIMMAFKFTQNLEIPDSVGVRNFVNQIGIAPNYKEVVLREKQEFLAYFLSILFTPLILFFVMFFSQRILIPSIAKKTEKYPEVIQYFCKFFIIVSGVFVWIGTLVIIGLCDPKFSCFNGVDTCLYFLEVYMSLSTIVWAIFLFVFVIYFGVFSSQKIIQKKVTLICAILSAVLALWISSYLLFDEYSAQGYLHNFDPVVYPMIQTYFGKMPMVDFKSHYGMHALFVQPLFYLFDLTIRNLSILMMAMYLISLLLVIYCIFQVVKNPLIALLVFISIIYMNLATTWWPIPAVIGFQYYSIRMLFPACLLGFLCGYIKKPTQSKYYGSLIFFSVGTMWNLDVGIPAFLTLTGFIAYEKISIQKKNFNFKAILLHIFTALTILSATWLALYSYIKIKTGIWPDFSLLIYGHRSSAEFGYSMMAIDRYDIWYLPIAVYVASLVFAIDNLLNNKREMQDRFILILSLLGIFIFTYYLGRSHTANILGVSYPALILLGIFADKFCAHFKKKDFISIIPRLKSEAILFAFPLVVLSYLSVVCITHLIFLKPLHKNFLQHYLGSNTKKNPYQMRQAEFMQSHIPQALDGKVRDDIIIVSLDDEDSYFSLALKAKSPINLVNFSHLFFDDEIAQIYQLLESEKIRWVALPRHKFHKMDRHFSKDEILHIHELLTRNYKISSQMTDSESELVIYERK